MPSPTPSDSADAAATTDSTAAFDAAAAAVEAAAAAGTLPASDALHLYALFKQATVGDAAPGAKPPLWDVRGRAKWSAWAALGGMSAEDARAAYVEAAAAAVGGGGGGGGPTDQQPSMGPVFSSLPTVAGAAPPGLTRLGAAAADGDAAGLAAALDGGADPSAQAEADDRATPLHLAADAGSLDCVRVLLAAGADVNAVDAHGGTPLSYAVAAGREAVADALRGAGGVE
jgi:acyl-CoA-binding protein